MEEIQFKITNDTNLMNSFQPFKNTAERCSEFKKNSTLTVLIPLVNDSNKSVANL